MSDEIINAPEGVENVEVSNQQENFQPEPTPEPEMTQEQVVAWESHQKLLNQRKADQKRARALEDELKALKDERKANENARLEEKQEYKKLYEASKQELEQLRREKEEERKIIVNKEKQAALSKELGGLKKDEYFKFADLNNIVIDDYGNIDENSVRLEANRYRQSYPELINATNPVRVNSQAPGNNNPVVNQPKNASKMSAAEREAAKRNILMKKGK